jgi:hypothetical protein
LLRREYVGEGRVAYLCGGTHPANGRPTVHILPPLYAGRVRRLRGNSFVIVGAYMRDTVRVHVEQPQAWWCRLPSQLQSNWMDARTK